MSFQAISDLFADRSQAVTDADLRHYIEGFLKKNLYTDALYCEVVGLGAKVTVRVREGLIAQQVLLLTRDIQVMTKKDLDCDIGIIRAIVE